jgi:hypothetical protein
LTVVVLVVRGVDIGLEVGADDGTTAETFGLTDELVTAAPAAGLSPLLNHVS